MNFGLKALLSRTTGTSACVLNIYPNKAVGAKRFIGNRLNNDQTIDYKYFTNVLSKRRRPSMLRELTHVMSRMPPETISFAVGVPNVNTFPFEEINVKLKDGKSIVIGGKDLSTALQYLPSRGFTELIGWLRKLQEHMHGKKDWSNTSILVTAGGQEALCNSIEMCMEEGSSVLVQDPVYPAVADLVRPYRPNYLSLPQDKDGIRPDILQKKLEYCIENNMPLPKLLYVNPTGCNPAGVSLTTERKKIIYEIACKYNFLILEDDSYYYLHFMKEDPVSFLSLDTEGRVVRFDSFSKILSSGLRVGFVTGPEPLLRNIELHLQVSTLHASALSQMIIYKMFELMGIEGVLAHFRTVRDFYKIKKTQMIEAVERHLRGLVEWNQPSGGMFLWVKVNGINNVYNMALRRCVENNLLVVPGHPFMFLDQESDCSYLRMSYSLATQQQMEQGCARLAEMIRAEKESLQLRSVS
uniref:Putative kynurenine/alpha-aminoadipate aminotransferase n=1 Tax=Triatoma dimidiata TaxID=72491 RepID=A0A0V0GD31_TRIDM